MTSREPMTSWQWCQRLGLRPRMKQASISTCSRVRGAASVSQHLVAGCNYAPAQMLQLVGPCWPNCQCRRAADPISRRASWSTLRPSTETKELLRPRHVGTTETHKRRPRLLSRILWHQRMRLKYCTNSYWRYRWIFKIMSPKLGIFPSAFSLGEYSQLRGKHFKYSPITSVTISFVIPQTISIIAQNQTYTT